MVDVQLYRHAVLPGPRTPLYSDYYLPRKYIRDMSKDRVWGLDVWHDLQERRRWAVANRPYLSLDINVNQRRRRNRSSEYTAASGFMLGVSHGIYLTHRIRRPCTVDIPGPLISVNIRDGVCLHKGRARLERVRRRSEFSPAVVAIHLDLPDEEHFRKFKDLSNHLARVVEEPDDRGFFFWFIRRGQWNTPIRGSSAYFIDLDGKHKKYTPGIHARDCIKFVVELNERTHPSPLPSSSPSSSSSTDPKQPPSPCRQSPPPPPPRVRTEHTAFQTRRKETQGKETQTLDQRVRTEDTAFQTRRIETQGKETQTLDQSTDPKQPPSRRLQSHPSPPPRNQTDKHVKTSESPPPDAVFDDDEVVLARWEDDRWYYKGRIVKYMENDHYMVEDSTGRDDIINREDIVRITDNYNTVSSHKRVSGCVLAPHPIYYWSYAPGRVIETLDQLLTVRFYDNNLKNINRRDVYPARNREKHYKDVEEIRQREKDWVGLEAFIRDESGVYKLGTVEEQIGRQQKYAVRWDDGQCGEQMSIHIYGTYTPMIKFKVGSYILALVDPDRMHFLPGQVRNVHGEGDDQRLDVEFVNGKSSRGVLSKHSYWMNKMAFHEAKEMFLRHHQDRSDEEDSPRYCIRVTTVHNMT